MNAARVPNAHFQRSIGTAGPALDHSALTIGGGCSELWSRASGSPSTCMTSGRTLPFLDAPGDGARVETDEFDMYRIIDGRIHEVEALPTMRDCDFEDMWTRTADPAAHLYGSASIARSRHRRKRRPLAAIECQVACNLGLSASSSNLGHDLAFRFSGAGLDQAQRFQPAECHVGPSPNTTFIGFRHAPVDAHGRRPAADPSGWRGLRGRSLNALPHRRAASFELTWRVGPEGSTCTRSRPPVEFESVPIQCLEMPGRHRNDVGQHGIPPRRCAIGWTSSRLVDRSRGPECGRTPRTAITFPSISGRRSSRRGLHSPRGEPP